MKRTLATACTVTLLALPLSACGDKDSGAAAKSEPDTATTSATTETPSEAPSETPTELPTDVSTDAPTETSSAQPAGDGVDGCALVTEQLLTTDLGFASGGQLLSQPSSYGDPASKDCYYAADSGDLVVVKATSRASTDMPESDNTLAGLPGAEELDDVDWGFVYILSPSPIVAEVVFAKGEVGLDMSVTSTSDVTMEQLKKFAADVIAQLG